MSWRRFLRRAKWDRERRAEIESYLEIETDENAGRGMSEREAEAAARRKFGNSTRVREEIYSMNTIALVDSLARDVQHGLRMLKRSPAFAAVALLTLGVGIGANTAVFSVVNSVLLKPLPYPDSDRLVAVWHKAPGAPGLASVSGDLRLSASMYFTYAEQNRTFEALGVWAAGQNTVTGLAEPERVASVYVSDGALDALHVAPVLGRWLSGEDQAPRGRAAVMLGYGYWQRRFGGDRAVIGRNITVDAQPREIVGVMPQGFEFIDAPADLILPLAFDRSKVILPGFGYQCVARLKRGVPIEQASADIARLVPVWMSSWPMVAGVSAKVYEKWRITPALRPLKQDVIGGIGGALWVVMGTIGLVMLVVCANIANLLLVRAEARQQELAVRAALGAGRGRIVRELLSESLLLALMGGILGGVAAEVGLRLVVAAGPGNLPRLSEISLDGRGLGFALGVSALSGILLGLIPAWKYAGPGIADALRGGGRTSSQSRERHRARNLLVAAQMALALVLLVSAGLMIRTFQALLAVQPGFTHPEQIQVLRISIPDLLVPEPGRAIRMLNDIVDRLAAIPGVSSAAFARSMPMEGIEPSWDVIAAEGTADIGFEKAIPPLRFFEYVSPGLFQTMGTRLVAGRDYTWTDVYGRRPFAIVSENLAHELWGSSRAAVGKRISTGLPGVPWREVIGVAEDVRKNGVQEPAPAVVYWPAYGESLYGGGRVDLERDVTVAIRSGRAGSEAFLRQVRQAVWSVNASLPIASVRTMQEVVARSMARTSFTLVMLGIAGAMALLLGIVGIYGVISYAVSQRRREIGIRVALGARPGDMSRMFVRYGLGLAAIGVGIGLAAAAGLMQLMKSVLFGIGPWDPVTYVVMPVVLVLAAVVSSYGPARRAARVDPVLALKDE